MSRGFLRKSSVNTFIGIVWILFAVGTSAQNAVSKFRADSIRQSLSRIQKPQDKIPLLKELIGLYWQLPEEVPALKEIIDIAMPLDSIGIVYDAMAGLSRYYPAIRTFVRVGGALSYCQYGRRRITSGSVICS